MSDTASLLVELLTEELPPKALLALSEAFAGGIEKSLRAAKLLANGSRATAFGAPRRMAVHITEVAARSADEPFKTKLMPKAVALDAQGKPTPALRKKLAALGREGLADRWPDASAGPDSLVVEADGKAESLFLRGIAAGSSLQVGLQSALEEALARLPIPKVMNYQLADGTTVQFVRPAHGLVALHGPEVVRVNVLGLEAGSTTAGHRFHSTQPIRIDSADRYAEALRSQGKVIASFAERRARIVYLLQAAAQQIGGTALMPAELLEEVTALVEWPVVYESGFEKEFLEVPQECLVLTMQQNQKYFALQDGAGRLMNRFLLVSHIDTADPAAIVAGNARVVRARLADARFFYEQDRKQTLESRIGGLASVVYHSKLGSQLERVERLTSIAVAIARELGVDVTHAERAARLAKADLRTLMVGEFPELQGIMGTYYARHDGEPSDVADAIEQHYHPRFAGDALPASRVGLVVALADKIETLVGLFGVGERPTGEKDPYALRRHALGVLRMLLEARLPLRLDRLLAIGVEAFGASKGFAEPRTELQAFLYERLRGLLREQGYSANEVESVVALQPQRIDDLVGRLAAVRTFVALPEAESLAAANKRISNILKKSDGAADSIDGALLFEPAEQSLAAALDATRPAAQQMYAAGDYTGMLKSLAPLKLPVDRFFDDVMVNVDDPKIRANRLALLAALRDEMNRVADLSLLAAG